MKKSIFFITLLVLYIESFATTYIVDNISDSGSGTLREAINNSNNNSNLDSIHFNLPGSGPWEIILASDLDYIYADLIIDATTQPGWNHNVIVNRNSMAGYAIQATLGTNDSRLEVYGLTIKNAASGIYISGVGGSDDFIIGAPGKENTLINNSTGIYITNYTNGQGIIQSNFIGVDMNDLAGINNIGIRFVNGCNNIIVGGSAADEGNIISGNNKGVTVEMGTQNVNFYGNIVGLNAAGNAVVSNNTGIELDASTTACAIGGAGAFERNIISGNIDYGVLINGDNMVLVNNYIGTNLSGTASVSNDIGIQISGNNNTVGGLTTAERNVISGNNIDFMSAGMIIYGNSNSIIGNYIGLSATGTTAIGNRNGIEVAAGADNTIGNATAAGRNIISGNVEDGIEDAATDTYIYGNYIGTNPAGTSAIGNTSKGIHLLNAAQSHVGGSNTGEGNLISGNGTGIEASNGADYCEIKGNIIGLNASKSAEIQNNSDGVRIFSFTPGGFNSYITIGGPEAGAGNIIAGNNGDGIEITLCHFNSIQGNFIGITDNLTTTFPNGAGINITSQSTNNLVGGNVPSAGNYITTNFGTGGVMITNVNAINNTVKRNSIYCNTSKGIDLNALGNNNHPAPVISSATSGCTVSGTAAAGDSIHIYIDDSCAPISGKTYLGAALTDGSGNWTAVNAFFSTGNNITATATDVNGNTSEFSNTVVGSGGITVNIVGLNSTYCDNDAIDALSGTPSGGAFTGSGMTGSNFNPASAGSGTHTVTYTYSTAGCDYVAEDVTEVFAAPSPSITYVGGGILETGSFSSYQWYLDGSPISGATSQSYGATSNGNYTVEVTNSNGCSSISSPYLFNGAGITEPVELSLEIYPNPNTGTFNLNLENTGEMYLFDIAGNLVLKEILGKGNNEIQADLESGIYTVVIYSDSLIFRQRIVVNGN